MTWVTLGVGTNVDATANLTSCLDMLLLQFHDMAMSSVFECEAVGYDGPAYLNMVVGMETEMSLRELVAFIKEVERKHGRTKKSGPGTSTLDIDILTYGHLRGSSEGVQLPRPGISENAYVLWPLSQIAGRHRHPELNITYGELWHAFDRDSQKIRPVRFVWHNRVISEPEDRK